MKAVSMVWMVMALSLLGCADTAPESDSNAGCDKADRCECTGGRSGTKVCDLDTGEFVMCLCSTGSAPDDEDSDAGSSPSQPTTVAGAPAAGSGGTGGAAAVSGASGSAGEGALAGAGGARATKGRGKGAERSMEKKNAKAK